MGNIVTLMTSLVRDSNRCSKILDSIFTGIISSHMEEGSKLNFLTSLISRQKSLIVFLDLLW